MKRVMQFRYFGSDDPRTYPKIDFSENILRNYGNVSHLGIQAPPGVEFYLNSSTATITVGSTGIYELDLGNLGTIRSIRFPKSSLNNDDVKVYGIIVDVVYEGA